MDFPSSPPLPGNVSVHSEDDNLDDDGMHQLMEQWSSPTRLPRQQAFRLPGLAEPSTGQAAHRYFSDLNIQSDALADFLESDGALVFNNFETEAAQVDPKRVQENRTLNQYYGSKKELWEEVDVRSLRIEDPFIQDYRKIVNQRFKLQAKSWQIAAMKDILAHRIDVVVSAGTSQGKSLTFQALPILSKSGIVLVICPTLALMDDQV